jgi:hypothetical protein
MDREVAERRAADTRRSYRFVIGVSVLAWLVVVALLVAATGLHAGRVAGVLASTVALAGWLAFLRGHERRDLARLEGLAEPAPPRFDPRS